MTAAESCPSLFHTRRGQWVCLSKMMPPAWRCRLKPSLSNSLIFLVTGSAMSSAFSAEEARFAWMYRSANRQGQSKATWNTEHSATCVAELSQPVPEVRGQAA